MAFAMNLPVVIIVTKTDLLATEDQESFLKDFKRILIDLNSKRNPLVTKTQEDIVMFSRNMQEPIVPIFFLSNKTGAGLELFRNFLNILPTNLPQEEINNTSVQVSKLFSLYKYYIFINSLIFIQKSLLKIKSF
jgi:GTPase